MARKSKLTSAQIEDGINMRSNGYTWVQVAEKLEVSRATAMYHCSPQRKQQVQKAIRKYHKDNYDKVRTQQKHYAVNTKIQQEET